MDINKLQLERKRDQIWALARKDMPLFEKFFNNEASELEATQVAVIGIQLITTELYVYRDEIENISKELLDLCKGRSKIAAGGGLKSRHPRHTYTTTPTVSITFYSLFQYTNKLLFIYCQQLYHLAADQAV